MLSEMQLNYPIYMQKAHFTTCCHYNTGINQRGMSACNVRLNSKPFVFVFAAVVPSLTWRTERIPQEPIRSPSPGTPQCLECAGAFQLQVWTHVLQTTYKHTHTYEITVRTWGGTFVKIQFSRLIKLHVHQLKSAYLLVVMTINLITWFSITVIESSFPQIIEV